MLNESDRSDRKTLRFFSVRGWKSYPLSNNKVIYKKADNPRMIVFRGINLWLSNTLAVHPSNIFTTFSALTRKLCFGAVREKQNTPYLVNSRKKMKVIFLLESSIFDFGHPLDDWLAFSKISFELSLIWVKKLSKEYIKALCSYYNDFLFTFSFNNLNHDGSFHVEKPCTCCSTNVTPCIFLFGVPDN